MCALGMKQRICSKSIPPEITTTYRVARTVVVMLGDNDLELFMDIESPRRFIGVSRELQRIFQNCFLHSELMQDAAGWSVERTSMNHTMYVTYYRRGLRVEEEAELKSTTARNAIVMVYSKPRKRVLRGRDPTNSFDPKNDWKEPK